MSYLEQLLGDLLGVVFDRSVDRGIRPVVSNPFRGVGELQLNAGLRQQNSNPVYILPGNTLVQLPPPR